MRQAVNGKAFSIMVVFCFIMGLQQVAIKAVAADISPVLQIALRSGVAALLVWLFSRVIRRERWLTGVGLRAGLVIGVLFAAEYFLMAEGLLWTSASHMAVFLYTAPIFAAIGLHLRLPEERLNRLQWGGITLAFLGIAVTFLLPSLTAGRNAMAPGWLLGDLLGLCAGLSWGMTTVAIRVSRLSEAPPTQTLFYQLAYAFVLLLGLAAITDQLQFRGTTLAWASMGFQTFIVCFAAMLTWFFLLRHFLAAKLGVLLFMTPLFGVALGVVLLDEPLSPAFVIGSMLVLVGLLVVNSQAWLPALLPGIRSRQKACGEPEQAVLSGHKIH